MTDFRLIINPENHAAATPEQVQLADQAQARVAMLLGPPPAGGHSVGKGGSGPCRICGRRAKLTFEHVPPHSSGNIHRRRAVDLVTSLTVPPGQMPRSGWVSRQRGAGDYATCSDCNSFGGTAYVPAYSDAVAAAVIALQQAMTDRVEAGDTSVPETVRLQTVRGFRPGAVIRQAVFMLMAMSGSAGFGDRYPVLRKIVLDGARMTLPGEMVIRLSLVISQRVRIHPVVAEIKLDEMEERALLEVAHLPFAWLAEIGPRSNRPAPDVSSWTEIDPADEHNVDLTLPVGAIVTAIPDDRRHLWEIPKDASE